MAIIAGLNGSAQAIGDTDEHQFLSIPSGVRAPTTIMVKAGVADIVVRIPELHGDTAKSGCTIAAGDREYFRIDNGGISSAYVSGGATSTVTWSPVAHTKL